MFHSDWERNADFALLVQQKLDAYKADDNSMGQVITRCLKKNVPLCNCPFLWQVSTDFQNVSIGTHSGQLAIKWLLNFPPPPTVTVSLHYLVKYKCKKKTYNNRQQVCWKMTDTLHQNCDERSVLDPPLCI